MKQRFVGLFVLARLSVGYTQQKAPISKLSGTIGLEANAFGAAGAFSCGIDYVRRIQ